MTPREAEIMQAHVAYCGKLLQAGKAIVFGPVADPLGVWVLACCNCPTTPIRRRSSPMIPS